MDGLAQMEFDILPESVNLTNIHNLFVNIPPQTNYNYSVPLGFVNLISVNSNCSLQSFKLSTPIDCMKFEEIFDQSNGSSLRLSNIPIKARFYSESMLISVVPNTRQEPLFKVSFMHEYKTFLSLQHYFFSNNQILCSSNFHIIPIHFENFTLTLDRIAKSVSFSFNIVYSISIKESIYFNNTPQILSSLKSLSEYVFTPNLTLYQAFTDDQSEPTVSSFYSSITHNTDKYANHSDATYLKITGIYKTLLPYQGESLKWMLNHEGIRLIQDLNTEQDLFDLKSNDENSISKILDRLAFGWSCVNHYQTNQKLWWNSYTGAVCTTEFVLSYISRFPIPPPAKAFLCEEMGLGKTLEVIALIKLHPRIKYLPITENKQDTFDPTRKISECKTTLILCPQTIIHQWLQEINSTTTDLKVKIYKGITKIQDMNPGMTPFEVANHLSTFDVVLTSYSTLAKELDRAIFKPTSRPKRKSAKHERVDYSSPLMLLEFHRLVLDEAQLATISISRVAKFSRILPRVHTWCVSGTLIRKDLQDLLSLLRSHRYYPLDRLSAAEWKLIPRGQFDRLVTTVCLRHTKEMVGDQVKLPKQRRIMLRMPFGAIEGDNYANLYNRFLQQAGLNEKGEPIVESYDLDRSRVGMRKWCIWLRMVCCHALLLKGIGLERNNITNIDGLDDDGNNSRDINDELMMGTLDDVLKNLIRDNESEHYNNDRSYLTNLLKSGKIWEFLRRPDKSVKVFEKAVEELEKRVERFKLKIGFCVVDNEKKTWMIRLRNTLESLHQSYFMLASSHYQHYKPMRPIPDSFKDLEALKIPDDNEKLGIDAEILTTDEKLHYDLENEYYRKADGLLSQLLDEPWQKTQEMILKLNLTFDSIEIYKPERIPELKIEQINNEEVKLEDDDETPNIKKKVSSIPIEDLPLICMPINELLSLDLMQHASNLGISFILNRAMETLTQLDSQGTIINLWFKRLIHIQKNPVTNTEDDITGTEYTSSLIAQETSQAYIDELQLILDDRDKALNSTEDSILYSSKTTKNKRHQPNPISQSNAKTPLSNELDALRIQQTPHGTINPRFSLKTSLLELTDEMTSTYSPGTSQHDQLSVISDKIKREVNIQSKNIRYMRGKLLDVLNDAFNSKVAYYKSLQMRSDSLVNFKPSKVVTTDNIGPELAAEWELKNVERMIQDYQIKVVNCNARLNYLKSLIANGKNDDTTKNDDTCVICRYTILVGTLTPCGHKYCRDCLIEWMKAKSVCPICKKTLKKEHLYNFTYSRSELRGDLVDDVDKNSNKEAKDNDKEEVNDDYEEDEIVGKEELGLLKNRRMIEKDMDVVYQSMDSDVLKSIMSIPLDKSYGTKIDMILRQIKYLKKLDSDVQILIFSQWNRFLNILGRAMRNEKIDYRSWVEKGILGDKLNTDIQDFKKDKSITCFILNTVAQAAGLTFTNASHVFLCEPMVNLSFELQAVSRIHRIGQTKETTVWNFVVEGTIEESIAYLSTQKRIQAARSRSSKINDDYGDKITEIDENVLEAEELTKANSDLINKKDGEVISDGDLWASFFAAKSARVMHSVYG